MNVVFRGLRRSGVATRHGMLLVRLVPWVETHGYYPSPLRGGVETHEPRRGEEKLDFTHFSSSSHRRFMKG